MDEINWIRVIAGLFLVLFLPGYTLIQALFPRRGELDEEFDTLYRITLGMAMSICVVILLGFVLGNPSLGNAPDWEGISEGEKGYFQTFFITFSLVASAIGVAPTIKIASINIVIIFFIVFCLRKLDLLTLRLVRLFIKKLFTGCL